MSATFVPQTKDSAIARILTRPDGANAPLPGGKHAGMAIVVGRRHVMTCAHVLNYAAGRPAADEPEPLGPFAVTFPLSQSAAVIEGKVVAWHPMKPRVVDDIAVLALGSDVPADVGVAIFTDTVDPLDDHVLSVFGMASDDQPPNHVRAIFMGPVNVGQSQIDGTGDNSGVFVKGGYSGAAVWDNVEKGLVGMVRARSADPAEQVAYMVPVPALNKSWPTLPVETRRLPASFNGLWTGFTSLFFLVVLVIFLMNRNKWPTTQLSAFAGMNIYALVAPFVGLMWRRYSKEFSLRPWSTRIPRFGGFKAEAGSASEKLFWAASVFFLILLPLYAQGHFIRTFHNQGDVLIYSSAFGLRDEDIEAMECPAGSGHHCQCWKSRSNHLCQHPEAGRYSMVKPASPDKGGFWSNYYHYGEISIENESVTFFPILQPLIVNLLTALTVALYGAALWRTFRSCGNDSPKHLARAGKSGTKPLPTSPRPTKPSMGSNSRDG
ncbi:serine protease [Mesorhizobium sp. M1060]|uniref:S1 family peptidase n=1 Tax=Mesorhizobium sp. M1060 TaxID=2957052 RepID=UPI00333551CE